MQQQQALYLTYKLGLICPHGQNKTSTNYVDVGCSDRPETYHRVSQVGKICNKCATLIMKTINSVEYCPCCSQNLEQLISSAWICTHRNRTLEEITIKCLNDEKETHEVPFRQKVCKSCYDKIRASFMFASSCVVCNQKQTELFQNIEKTITKPSFYFFEQITRQMRDKKFKEDQIKAEIEHYCLAEPRKQFSSKFQSESAEYGENQAQSHQSKRYQLYPKCPKHRYNPIQLCNNCLVSILNVNMCPYGCAYEKKQTKPVKGQAPVINQSGFLCLYPKQTKDYQYLQYFCIRHIEQSNRFDKWEGSLKKIKYEGTEKICDKFALYASSVQVGQFSFFYSGGVTGSKIAQMKSTDTCFLVHIQDKNKKFVIENVPSMSQPRASHGTLFSNDYVYVIGGLDKANLKYLSSCQRFNLKTKKWQTIPNLKVERSKPTVFECQGKIYAAGGISNNQLIWEFKCQVFNTDKNSWQNVQYKGYDIPFLTGASSINASWGLQKSDNAVLIGGSDYTISSYFMQQLIFKNNGLKIDTNGQQRLNYQRVSAALSTMKTDSQNEKIVLVFGGLQQHDSVLSLDAIRVRKLENEISPIFIYDNVEIGSYRLLLRQNALSAYTYMLDKLVEQGLISKQKLKGKYDEDILKSQEALHMIEKMWYSVGKCLIGFNGF